MTEMTKTQKKRVETLKATQEKRKKQLVRVYELKISTSVLSKSKKEKLNQLFVQAKWVVNDYINFINDNNGEVFNYKYNDHRTVKVKYPNECIEKDITLPTALHQDLIDGKKQDIKNLAKSKKTRKVGRLKFKKEVNCIPCRTGMVTLLKKNKNKLTIPGFRNIRVRGLDEVYKLKEFEVANCKIIRKASGFYIKLSVMIPRRFKKKHDEIGIDFGIKKAITTSDGRVFDPVVEESEHLKCLQKKLSKQNKGSNNYWKTQKALRREYEHLNNKKDDLANKIVHELTKDSIVYFQDEQLAKWKKKKKSKKTGKKCGFSFGRKIQHSVLGRIKSKLMMKEKETKHRHACMISKWKATTKICFKCGTIVEMPVTKRIFKCPKCGFKKDRDVHAALNIKKVGSLKRAECLEQTSVETKTSAFDKSSDLAKSKSCR